MTRSHTKRRRPSKEELEAARGKALPDLTRPRLRVLFCGINPSLYSVAIGHHFGRPGNRFWPTLFRAGFVDRLLDPSEERELLVRGFGITNVVARATASAAELTPSEYRTGAALLQAKVESLRPAVIAFVGIGAYRIVAGKPLAAVGPQPEPFGGAGAWVLPNPSGLNAHYQLDELAVAYGELARAVRAGAAERRPVSGRKIR